VSGAFSSGVSHKSFGTAIDAAEVAADVATQAELDTVQTAVAFDGQTGMTIPNQPFLDAIGEFALISGRAMFSRFVLPIDMTIASISFVVNTGASSDDNIDVGIYTGAGAKIVASGAVSGKLNAAGTSNVDIVDTALTANTVYYAALASGTHGGSAAGIIFATPAYQRVIDFYGAALPTALTGQMTGSQHPLPAAITYQAHDRGPMFGLIKA